MQEKHLTKGDLEDLAQLLGGLLDKQTAVLATKEELNDLRIELKDYMREGFETVMQGVEILTSKPNNS